MSTAAKSKVFSSASECLADHWTRLDEFEGEEYERVLTTVKLKDGTAVDAYIYALLSPTGGS